MSWIRSRLGLLAALLAGPALAACGSSESALTAQSYCPSPLTVEDAARLTRFKPGTGRDPRDIVFEAQVVAAGTQCSISRKRMEVDVIMRIAVNAGPSITPGAIRVPFFVRVLSGSGSVVVGRDEFADYRITASSPRSASQEELAVTLPFNDVRELGGYRIAVGLKPTQDELNYNRRAVTR